MTEKRIKVAGKARGRLPYTAMRDFYGPGDAHIAPAMRTEDALTFSQ